ncbi:cation diffusion facilitator family transporter [Mucilaginibacter arboris]|uniref:Cation diffusion facilitator family transporter n=1 Tax=Mucilaginibacter arboris TaxID=2682090 RepID=A0A7K1SZH0_9SPHI|nr:cation diffusion facilitator family transporter [Mucilaginibacter arboris]MVN22440.1 cation diffusion facilitator family transporter [Mucilaginibacter arboris]
MHAHSHDHAGHDHSHHHHAQPLTHVNTAFIVGISMNFIFVIVEAIAGLYIHSVSLLSDAGHNLADVAGLGLSLLAFRLLKVKSTNQYTYGYRKTSVLVALFNSVVLLLSIGAIAYEAVLRLIHPEPLPGLTIAIVAGIGIFINAISALMFLRDKDKDMNIKSAYLHLMFDALVSFGLVVGGVIIYYTHWFWLDSVLSIAIVLILISSTWNLLKESFRLSVDGVPDDIDIEDLRKMAIKIPGVKDLHHIHVWAISTTENALTAHLVLEDQVQVAEENKIKHQLKHNFEHQKIQHSTLETERENDGCNTTLCD